MRVEYSDTQKAYSELGETYIENIKDGQPPETFDFIKLFNKGDSVLEIGTAGGRDAKIFTEHGIHVTGIDITPEFIDIAKEAVPEAQFQVMDVLDIAYEENTFDGVWANAVLLHLKREDVPLALQNIYRVLKRGGKAHVRVKKGGGETTFGEEVSQNKERFFSWFSREEVESLMKDAGFTILLSETKQDDLGRDIEWVTVWGEK